MVGLAALAGPTTVGTRTDALDASVWEQSQWISVVDAPVLTEKLSLRSADGASWFVSTVKNERRVKKAVWMTTGLGVFELYLNGQPVGEEILRPGFTDPEKTKYAFTYDITAAFRKKAGQENVLSAQVTPGWWADKIVTPNEQPGMVGKKCAFRAVLELTYDDGSKACFGTDTDHWTAGIAGPVKHAGIFDGEEYDARDLPGYATPELLSRPEVNTEFDGEILPSSGAEVWLRKDLTLNPKQTYVWEEVKDADLEGGFYGTVVIKRDYAAGETIELQPGETLVVDFGQNAAAVPAFEFQAEAGTRLTCLPGEILNDGNGSQKRGMDGPEGSVHRRNLRLQDIGFRMDYTFGPAAGYVSYYPHCTFFGYRYISVTATAPVRIRSVVSVPVSSIAQNHETGRIITGNPLINQLISNTTWSLRSNYLSVPTDCPQRDERLGWTADAQVFAETGTFFANTGRFFHKWMRDMRDSQTATGAFPSVAPNAQYGRDLMRIGWADAGIIVPWTVWKQFGDVSIIDENWEAMDKFMTHVDESRYEHFVLEAENGHDQFADWVSYEGVERGWKRAAYWSYLGGCYWVLDAGMMRDMALASGRDAAPYEAMVNRAKEYMQRDFLLPDGTFRNPALNDMQTPALFALKAGLVEGQAKENMIKRLRQNFADHDGCLQTGFLGTSILMQTLTENGMSDIAWNLLFQRKNPSWLYSVDNGATTIWELWNSYTKENGLASNSMNSFNHYAYGCVCQWIWETAAGIQADPAEPGFRHIIMKPIPDKRLGSLDAEFNSPAGLIKSSWKYEGDTWVWTFTIPKGATATVTLPGENESREYNAGTWKIVK